MLHLRSSDGCTPTRTARPTMPCPSPLALSSPVSSPVRNPVARQRQPSCPRHSLSPLPRCPSNLRTTPRESACRKLEALPGLGKAPHSPRGQAVDMAMDLLAGYEVTIPLLQFSKTNKYSVNTTTPTVVSPSSLTGPPQSPPSQAPAPAAPAKSGLDKTAVQELDSCLRSGDDRLVKGALLNLSDWITARSLTASQAAECGLMVSLSDVVQHYGLSSKVTSMALETLSRLIVPNALPQGLDLSASMAPTLLSLMREAVSCLGYHVEGSDISGWEVHSSCDPGGGSSRGPPSAEEWEHMTDNMFFAISCVLRLARLAEPAATLLAGGCIPLLVAILESPMVAGDSRQPSLIPQVSVFAVYKLAGAGWDPEANLHQLLHSRGVPALCGHLKRLSSDDSTRDMCSSLLLDLAMLETAPEHCAQHGSIRSIVQVMLASSLGSLELMHAVLIIARLANRSAACQMDAVREGAVPPLIKMMTQGNCSEQSHASRLLAILAQSDPTHETIIACGAFPAVMGIVRQQAVSQTEGEASLAREHAVSVVAVLAQNPDTHFKFVGEGLVPALVNLMQSDSHKTQIFVMATLLLLTLHEPRHAAVVTSAGAVPLLLQRLTQPPLNCSVPVQVQEYAAAVLVSMSRYTNIQEEIVQCEGVSSLLSVLLDPGSSLEVRSHTAEALAHFCLVPEHRRQVVGRASTLLICLSETLTSSFTPLGRWSAALLNILVTNDDDLVDEAMLCGIDIAASQVLLNSHLGEEEEEEGDTTQRNVQAAWLLSKLTTKPYHAKQIVRQGVIRPLLTMLQKSVSQSQEAFDGFTRARSMVPLVHCDGCENKGAIGGSAAASLALRVLYRHCPEARTELHQELALKSWITQPVVLPGLDEPFS